MNGMLSGSAFELGVAQAAITTLATALAIGIGFLTRPGRDTFYWTVAFTLGMLATYGVIAGELNDAELLRRASLGALMGAPAFLWSGFRALWGLRPHAWAGVAVAIASSAALVAVGDSGWYGHAYRTVFLVASLFAGAFVLDWGRSSARRRDRLLLPLVIVSIAFVATGAAAFVAGLLFAPSGGDDFALLRLVASLGMLVYVACALVAVLGVTLRSSALTRSDVASSEWQQFIRTASERLGRARRTLAPWSLVQLRIDDAADIAETAGATALAELSARFMEEVHEVFPAESDIGSPEPGTVVVLVPRADAVVRDHLRTTLDRVSHIDVHGALPIRPTASAGWAPVTVVGYDLDALLLTAGAAASLASEKGGDRWERVGADTVEQLLNELGRR